MNWNWTSFLLELIISCESGSAVSSLYVPTHWQTVSASSLYCEIHAGGASSSYLSCPGSRWWLGVLLKDITTYGHGRESNLWLPYHCATADVLLLNYFWKIKTKLTSEVHQAAHIFFSFMENTETVVGMNSNKSCCKHFITSSPRSMFFAHSGKFQLFKTDENACTDVCVVGWICFLPAFLFLFLFGGKKRI